MLSNITMGLMFIYIENKELDKWTSSQEDRLCLVRGFFYGQLIYNLKSTLFFNP